MDDMFESIEQDESDQLSFMDRLNMNGEKIIQFQENQIEIQKSINEFNSLLDINDTSSISNIKEFLLRMSSNLDKMRENTLLNGEIINQIKEEHDELKEEFSRMKKPDEIQAEINNLKQLIK